MPNVRFKEQKSELWPVFVGILDRWLENSKQLSLELLSLLGVAFHLCPTS